MFTVLFVEACAMRITKIQKHNTKRPVKVLDCFVDSGYVKLEHGSLPDVDNDFESNRRQDVKEYIERRYNHNGKQRVFSAGTFTTLKAKAVIKDVARTMRISPSLVNYLTALLRMIQRTIQKYLNWLLQIARLQSLFMTIHNYSRTSVL